MKKKINTTPLIIIIVLIVTIILSFIINKELDKPRKKELPNETEDSLIREIETIKIENTLESDLIDIDRVLDLL